MHKYTSYISTHFRKFVLGPVDNFAKFALAGVPLHLGNNVPCTAATQIFEPGQILRSVTRTGHTRQIRWCLQAGFIPETEQLLIAAEGGRMKAFKILCCEFDRMSAKYFARAPQVSVVDIIGQIIRTGNTDMYRYFYNIPSVSHAGFFTNTLRNAIGHTTNPYMIDCIDVHFDLSDFVESIVKYARAEVFARFLKIVRMDWSEYTILPDIVENPDLETVRMVLDIIAKPPVHDGTTKLETYISTYLGKLRRGPENDAALIEILREYNVYDHESYMIMYESDIETDEDD